MVASGNPPSQHDSDATMGTTTPRYATFNSTKLLLCGYPADDIKALAREVEAEGGRVLTKLYRGSSPHVIVCGTVLDPTWKEARKVLQHHIPTVTREWVEECIRQKAQVEMRRFTLKPLAGLQITATNFPGHERAAVEALVTAAGGTYTPEMFKGRSTHLICKTGTGKKYSAALQWRSVHVVSEAWVRESAALGYPAPEEQFKVLPSAQGLLVQGHADDVDRGVHSSVAAPPPTISGSAMCGNGSSRPQQQPQVSTSSGGAAPPRQQPDAEQQQRATSSGRAQRASAAAATAAIGQQASGTSRRSSQRLSQQPADSGGDDAAAAAAAAAADASEAAAGAQEQEQQQEQQQQRQSATAARLAALGIPDPDTAPMFLERVVLWWCGIPAGSSEHRELQTILHAYAGVRFPELCASTTHVMIGNNASVDELKAVQAFVTAAKRRVEVVSPAWLLLCQQEQRLVPADSRCRLQLNSLVRLATGGGVPAGGGGGSSNSNSSGGGVFANAATSRGGAPGGGDKGGSAAEGVWVPEFWKQQPADPLRLFDGCYFTLAAVQSHQSEHEKALGHIRRLGGKVFTADSTKPPPGWPKVFAICPASLARDAESALMSGDASFRLVAPSCRVTLHWIDMCIKRSELVRATSRNPLLAPLRFAVPLRDFAHVCVVASGYNPEQRVTIEKVVTLLGGTYLPGTLSSTRKPLPTHLMLPRWGPDAAGAATAAGASSSTQQAMVADSTLRKVAFAQKHRMEMVVSEWLLECAVEGRLVQEGLYRPAGELQALPGLGATQAGGGGGSQLPTTQLPPTQLQQQGNQTQSLVSRQGSGVSTQRLPQLPKPMPSQRPPAPAPAAAEGSAAAAAQPPKRSWFMANLVNSKQQQPGGPAAAAQQQAPDRSPAQGQPEQHPAQHIDILSPPRADIQATLVSPRSGGRKRTSAASSAPGKDAAGSGSSAGSTPGSKRAGSKRQRKQQQQQEEQNDGVGGAGGPQAGPAVAPQLKPLAGSPLLDVANILHASPPGVAASDLDAACAAVAAAAVPVPAPAASEPHRAAAPGGSSQGVAGGGGDDAALEGVLTVLNTLNSSKDLLGGPHASQLAGDVMPDQLLSGLSGSAGGGSGPGAGGSGSGAAAPSGGVRGSKRRPSALGGGSRGSSGILAADAAPPDSGGCDAAGVGGSSGGDAAAGAGAAKRPRRGSCAAAPAPAAAASEAPAAAKAGGSGGAMLPPARRPASSGGASVGGPPGAAAAANAAPGDGGGGGGTRGGPAGGGRFSSSSRRTAAPPPDFEPSQQVGYDVGDTAEALLAAGRSRSATGGGVGGGGATRASRRSSARA